jgi:hypothetical protein
MNMSKLQAKLRAGDPAARKESWKALLQEHRNHSFSRLDAKALQSVLLTEDDLDARTTGMICLDQILHSTVPVIQESFHSWLFHSFRHTRIDPGGTKKGSLVVTVCDNEYIRDVQALVAMARHFPSDRYPRTVFRHVALHAPDWEEIGLHRTEAICFIGRPSLFNECRIIDEFPRDLRFSIEPPGADEAMPFSNVCQNRPRAGRFIYPTTQEAVRRHDYAIVQRFGITLNGQKVIVVVVAGGTSLGTLAAAKWITTFPWDEERRTEYRTAAGLDTLDWSTRVEALLSVSATVHSPARPWKTLGEAKGLYLNKSRNVLKAPSRISVATDSGTLRTAGDVRYLLFDDDEVEFRGVDHTTVVAVCVKYCLDGRPDMSLTDLRDDPRLWPNGSWPVTGSPPDFFREHVQKRALPKEIIEVSMEGLNLKLENCKIEVIRARSNASGATAESA